MQLIVPYVVVDFYSNLYFIQVKKQYLLLSEMLWCMAVRFGGKVTTFLAAFVSTGTEAVEVWTVEGPL